MTAVHIWTRQMLGRDSLEKCTIAEVKELAEKFPFYAPAQFLLLQKLRQENSPYAAEQLQKAVLYYHDPLALENILSPEKYFTEIPEGDLPGTLTTPAISEEQPSPPAAAQMEEALPSDEIPGSRMESESNGGLIAVGQENDGVDESEITGTAMYMTGDEEAALPEESKQSEIPRERAIENETGPNSHIPSIDGEREPAESAETESAEPSKAVESGKDLLFEPYHTVDYFASQGIRLSQAESSDKFGKQLRSFTEWLRTMKKLPAAQPSTEMDQGTESAVRHLAEDSVHEAGVDTEAMAEVWLKQGNIQKALEIYHKLSLLEPSKRAYFAAKIDQLKSS